MKRKYWPGGIKGEPTSQETAIAMERLLHGDGPSKFGWPDDKRNPWDGSDMDKKCLVCGRRYGHHIGWKCPSDLTKEEGR